VSQPTNGPITSEIIKMSESSGAMYVSSPEVKFHTAKANFPDESFNLNATNGYLTAKFGAKIGSWLCMPNEETCSTN
jgi:hypothetical protein